MAEAVNCSPAEGASTQAVEPLHQTVGTEVYSPGDYNAEADFGLWV